MSSLRLGSLAVFVCSLVSVGLMGCSTSSSGAGGAPGTGGTGGSGGGTPRACDVALPDEVRNCVDLVNEAWASCYENGAPCTSDDANVAAALAELESEVERSCSDGDFLSLSVDALVGRAQNSCKSEADSIAWRLYGGPQGAVFDSASGSQKSCLDSAHTTAAAFIDRSLASINTCLTGDSCDAAALEAERDTFADEATTEIGEACGDVVLADVIAVNPTQLVDRLEEQVDCITATAHADTGELSLRCGPSNTDFEMTRGEWVRIRVDGDKWGTLCGDGSGYSFWVKFAPEGEPLDRLLVGLQGGGVCVLEPDCANRLENNPGLFTAEDDEPVGSGIASEDPEISPFTNWTQVYLPYCNQDVFAGGGVNEYPDTLDLPRFGTINFRAAARMVRDVLWKEMDAEGGAGFRPDEVITLFGGWSAGGYGALYNYHFFLDDLLWPRTIAFPDAGGALDNEEPFGVALLGAINIPESGWNMQPFLPSYCFAGDCAVGPFLYERISPRLKQVPEQQMLIVSNPYDDTQRRDAFFRVFAGDDRDDDDWRAIWLNKMRSDYCATKDLPGIQYYYTSDATDSFHVVTLREEGFWLGSVDGEVMSDWFVRAVEQPDTVEDRVEEGDFTSLGTENFPVLPYPCDVPD